MRTSRPSLERHVQDQDHGFRVYGPNLQPISLQTSHP